MNMSPEESKKKLEQLIKECQTCPDTFLLETPQYPLCKLPRKIGCEYQSSTTRPTVQGIYYPMCKMMYVIQKEAKEQARKR